MGKIQDRPVVYVGDNLNKAIKVFNAKVREAGVMRMLATRRQFPGRRERSRHKKRMALRRFHRREMRQQNYKK